MYSNLPDGVDSSTYGAPWSEQDYQVSYYLSLDIDGVEFNSDESTTTLTLSGPKNYTEDELADFAIETVREENDFIDQHEVTIIINDITKI